MYAYAGGFMCVCGRTANIGTVLWHWSDAGTEFELNVNRVLREGYYTVCGFKKVEEFVDILKCLPRRTVYNSLEVNSAIHISILKAGVVLVPNGPVSVSFRYVIFITSSLFILFIFMYARA